MPAPAPRMHGLTHVPGGPDPIPGLVLGETGLAGLILATPNLAGFWKLNETSGTTAADSSGGGLDLTSAGYVAPTWGHPPIINGDASAGFAAGTVMRLERATFPDLSGGDFTATVWFRRSGTSADPLIGQGAAYTSNGWALEVEAFNTGVGNRLTVIKGPGSDPLEAGPPAWPSDEHLAAVTFVHATNTWTLYLDGVSVGSEVDAFSGSSGIWVGAANPPSTTQVPDGDVAYAAVFTRALTAAELVAFHDAGTSSGGGITSIDGTTPTTLTGLLKGNGTDIDVAVAGTDYATPAQLSAKVDRDAVEIATARLVAVKLAAADTQPAFRILGNGKQEFGQGGTTAPDTNLYRSAANTLKTDGTLALPRVVFPSGGAGGDIVLGADTNLYRAGVNVLRSDSTVTLPRVGFPSAGAGGDIVFGGDTTANLYHSAAGVIKSDGWFSAAKLAGRRGADLTVTGNAITVTNSFHRITANAGAADLNTIDGGTDGDLLSLVNLTGATFNIGTSGNVAATGAVLFPNNTTHLLVYDGPAAKWRVVT